MQNTDCIEIVSFTMDRKLDGSRISSAWLGTCLDADGIAIVISTIGNDETRCLDTSGMYMYYTRPSTERL